MPTVKHRIRRFCVAALWAVATANLPAASADLTPKASSQNHWAFIKPERPPLPSVQLDTWPRNAIDYFILVRLEKERLRPSPEADRATLLRRVTLDLTGLPPTLAEMNDFLADDSANAYEKTVDRLLSSPRYGERMAFRWLEAARYADTSGYQSDGERSMWRWRDWVIEAFNRNLPFDQFTLEQIAGDLLPSATLEQKIATGFNRNHRGNGEGGIIPEEYAVEYVVDRVDTTCTVWLGLTMGCARCHDHKYDPFAQKEFYQLFAFFNNIPEKGRAVKFGNSPPLIKAPTLEQQTKLAQLERQLNEAEERFRKLEPNLATAQTQWEKSFTNSPARVGREKLPSGAREPWSISDGLVAHFDFDGDLANSANPPVAISHSPTLNSSPSAEREPGESRSLSNAVPRSAARFVNGEPTYAAGQLGRAAKFDGHRFVEAGNVGDFGFFDKFSCGAWIYPRSVRRGAILSRMAETPQADGYALALADGKLQANFVKRWLDDALRVETETALEPQQWHHVLFTYDGSRVASGVRIYVDGRPQKLKVNLDELNQSFKTAQPLRVGSGGGPENRFDGSIDDLRIYDRVLTPDEVEIVATVEEISSLAAIPEAQRTPARHKKLRAYYLEQAAPAAMQKAHRELAAARQRRDDFWERLPTTMVMEELPTPRETFVLLRGQYDKHGEAVTRAVPARLSPWPAGAPGNRLGFARWLIDPSHPLTARVAVNQYWQMYFGTGLVRTPEDFGTRGEPPSHPDLLDWLATEFIRAGWNVKTMQKLIVMSAAYRQSSKAAPDLLQRDLENRWLTRGPRLRLSAEMIRDQALAVSGLLIEKVGGPSVKPYQPSGLWKELSGDDYRPDQGEGLYRRSLYTFWKRTSAPPMMATFDAAGREMCSVRQTRTSTPLQALNLMNDVAFVEASRALAQRMLTESGPTPEDRITFAFRLAAARSPRADELKILADGLRDHLQHYQSNVKAAQELIKAGESASAKGLDAAELAACTALANLILNLDEAVTKQ